MTVDEFSAKMDPYFRVYVGNGDTVSMETVMLRDTTYTCPECGHDLESLMLTANPPIPKVQCPKCGWSWTGKQEDVIRVPFTVGVDNGQDVDFEEIYRRASAVHYPSVTAEDAR